MVGTGGSSGWPDLHAQQSFGRPVQWRGQAGRPDGSLALGAQPGWWLAQAGCPAGRTCTLSTPPPGLGGGGARRVVLLAGLAGSALCRPAWAVAGTVGSSGLPDLHGRHSVEWPGWWWRPAGCPAGRTSTLGTLPPSVGGDGALRVDQPAAQHSVPGLGGGRHRRVVRPAGLVRSALCRPAWVVMGICRSTRWPLGTWRPTWAVAGRCVSTSSCSALGAQPGRWRGPVGLPASSSALGARPGWWRAQVGRRAGRTCTLGTLPPGMGDGGARRVVQLARVARSALCRVARAVAGPGGSTTRPLGPRRSAWAMAGTGGSSGRLVLHAWQTFKRPVRWWGQEG